MLADNIQRLACWPKCLRRARGGAGEQALGGVCGRFPARQAAIGAAAAHPAIVQPFRVVRSARSDPFPSGRLLHRQRRTSKHKTNDTGPQRGYGATALDTTAMKAEMPRVLSGRPGNHKGVFPPACGTSLPATPGPVHRTIASGAEAPEQLRSVCRALSRRPSAWLLGAPCCAFLQKQSCLANAAKIVCAAPAKARRDVWRCGPQCVVCGSCWCGWPARHGPIGPWSERQHRHHVSLPACPAHRLCQASCRQHLAQRPESLPATVTRVS